MNKVKYILTAIAGIAIGILIGISVKTHPIASVIVTNSSTKMLDVVSISIGMTTYIVEDIEQNKSKLVNVFVEGEVGYRIKVVFANGDSLVNWNYIEKGYKVAETVSDSSIISSINKR